ncbi:hypothetical protein AMTR_s00036p00240870 [Amborella trichopoda]|uniref:Phosphatase n=1 Tax=Amborella trichopoda TaxID=13333 RepID=U5CZR2_AMBTC|nr:hypothetical protein AMTR_s00036p00240870 [Amborella trichopoda]
MAKAVVVFDFDETILDCDSDNWVVEEMGVDDLFKELLRTMPLNPTMDRMMGELHSRGKTIEEIAEILKRAPFDPRVISAIKAAHALGCDVRIVSDANTFFIVSILEHHGLLHCFTEINTNPAFIDDNGRLNIRPCHKSHNCPICPPNMCKGLVIERIQSEIVGSDRCIVYLGDGKGDYCPSLKLGHGDHVMPRKLYPFWDLLQSNPSLIKATIHEWSDAGELEAKLLNFIRKNEKKEEFTSESNGFV